MLLDDLRVVHVSKKFLAADAVSGQQDLSRELVRPDALFLNTDQTQLWIFSGTFPSLELPQLQLYCGRDAYSFLLRMLSGLQSDLQGDIEILGQFQQAWSTYEAEVGTFVTALRPWVQCLFEDAEDIRSTHLQELESASYGSWVSALLQSSDPSGPVLLVGSGSVARSIAPWLLGQELWLCDRSPERAFGLAADLLSRVPEAKSQVRVLETQEQESQGWREAAHVVICIPSDPLQDGRRIDLWKNGNPSTHRIIIHLGCTRVTGTLWAELPRVHTLENISVTQAQQTKERQARIERANLDCDQRAVLRSLTGLSSVRPGREEVSALDRVWS